MVNYNDSKIYKIEAIAGDGTDEVYVGSTTRPRLCQRFSQHMSAYRKWKIDPSGHTKMSSFRMFDKYGIDGCQILLLELFPCGTKDELLAKEGSWIQQLNTVNRCIAGRTGAEWRADNRDSVLKYQAEYREANHDAALKYQAEWREANRDAINARQNKRYLENKRQSTEN